jgi:hypothetical protein
MQMLVAPAAEQNLPGKQLVQVAAAPPIYARIIIKLGTPRAVEAIQITQGPRLLRGDYDCLDSNPADDDREHDDRIRCVELSFFLS